MVACRVQPKLQVVPVFRQNHPGARWVAHRSTPLPLFPATLQLTALPGGTRQV